MFQRKKAIAIERNYLMQYCVYNLDIDVCVEATVFFDSEKLDCIY